MTKIEWAEETWNPIVGCSVLSPGCTNCYAMKWAGCALDGTRKQDTGELKFPHYHGTTKKVNGKYIWTGQIAQAPEHILTKPLRKKKPTTYFVNSMGDLFHANASQDWIDSTFAVMAACPQHRFLVLTKRDDRMRHYMRAKPAEMAGRLADAAAAVGLGDDAGCAIANYVNGWSRWRSMPDDGNPLNGTVPRWSLPNVWLGVSVEDRARRHRIDTLRKIPAALRFLSIEPLLEDLGEIDLTGIGWVIIGGESGPHARPFNIEWARSIIRQTRVPHVPCFVKQLGARACITGSDGRPLWLGLRGKADRPDEWPEYLRVREFPKVTA